MSKVKWSALLCAAVVLMVGAQAHASVFEMEFVMTDAYYLADPGGTPVDPIAFLLEGGHPGVLTRTFGPDVDGYQGAVGVSPVTTSLVGMFPELAPYSHVAAGFFEFEITNLGAMGNDYINANPDEILQWALHADAFLVQSPAGGQIVGTFDAATDAAYSEFDNDAALLINGGWTASDGGSALSETAGPTYAGIHLDYINGVDYGYMWWITIDPAIAAVDGPAFASIVEGGGHITADAAVVPEPATLSLFGMGLAGALVYRRRRK